MAKILFSKSVPVPGYRVEVFCEKFWEPGLVQPLWRYGETFRCLDGRIVSRIQKSHLFSRPNIKRYIEKWYPKISG